MRTAIYRRLTLAITLAATLALAAPAAAQTGPLLTLGEAEDAALRGSIAPDLSALSESDQRVAIWTVDRRGMRLCERTSSRRVRCELVERGRVFVGVELVARWRCVHDAYAFRTQRGAVRVTRAQPTCNVNTNR